MAQLLDLDPNHADEQFINPATPLSELKTLTIPKRRSSLINARSGNSITSEWAEDSSPEYATSTTSSSNSVEDLNKQFTSELKISKRKPRSIDLTTARNALFTPPADNSGLNTPDVPASKALAPFLSRHGGHALLTPVKRRAISYGNIIDTPPSSKDRFIPRRSRGDTSIGNYRASTPFYQLSPDEKQMKLDGGAMDPFMARRVTPCTIATGQRNSSQNRAISVGGVWSVGGRPMQAGPVTTITAGRGVRLGSGTNAPIYNTNFCDQETSNSSHQRFEGRLAMALELDTNGKVLDFSWSKKISDSPCTTKRITQWENGEWVSPNGRSVLDAPSLRNDYYCTVLAHDPVSNVLAVGLRNQVYLWSEADGVQHPVRPRTDSADCYVTSLAFSSVGAGRSILAVGRTSGRVNLWTPKETRDRIQQTHRSPIACLTFKPISTRRYLDSISATVSTEELLVGDELGHVFYYSIHWPEKEHLTRPTSMVLLARLDLHKQQVCGLSWSPDGEYFASGGNDNVCYLLSIADVLNKTKRKKDIFKRKSAMTPLAPEFIPNGGTHITLNAHRSFSSPSNRRGSLVVCIPQHSSAIQRQPLELGPEKARHRWPHAAAVKAIAFCPWQRGLIATGGGSNDRAIHFFHTRSGACLATIQVHAQVTSLIWSQTRREICATFGYAQPDHPYRIAVFSWPECRQIVRIPWNPTMRALHAIPYPGGPNEECQNVTANRKGKARAKDTEGGTWWSRTKEEGCIVVASSDESVKFHEVWSGQSKSVGGQRGGLAWSGILESEEGGDIDFGDADVIR